MTDDGIILATMTEAIAHIETIDKLSGVIGLPDQIDPAKPTVVILNSGLMHHVGASRTSVKLSRALVQQGYLVLRFDLSGIGDSAARTDNLDPTERIIQEVSSALDYLQQNYGSERFVLYGLCSGSQNAFKTALVDKRIIGLAGVDNFGFLTAKYYLVHYLPKLLDVGHWKSFLGRGIKNLFASAKRIGNNTPVEVEEDPWPYPPKEFVENGYGQLVKRGLKFLYIYTGSWAKQYNYLNQFHDMFPSVKFGNSVELRFKPKMSHSLVEPDSQQFMIETVSEWLKTQTWSDAGTQ